jgi:hypothetical protein
LLLLRSGAHNLEWAVPANHHFLCRLLTPRLPPPTAAWQRKNERLIREFAERVHGVVVPVQRGTAPHPTRNDCPQRMVLTKVCVVCRVLCVLCVLCVSLYALPHVLPCTRGILQPSR